jgi:Circularly permutated YpsA SLOG family
MLEKIISGGQTGADRAALDWAIARSIPHGGACPKGRRAEDGAIPEKYVLTELRAVSYPARTERNVMDADGTLIATVRAKLTGGSKITLSFARAHEKPCLHVHEGEEDAAHKVAAFVREHGIRTLNVAGPRESTEPTIGLFVHRLLDGAFP